MTQEIDPQQFNKLFRAKLANIEKQIVQLQADLEAMKRAEDILFEKSIQVSLLNETSPISNELEGVKPTAGIFMIFERDPRKSWTAAQMGREMKKRGIKPTTENFDSVISSTLFRLAKKGRIEKVEKKGEATRFKKKAES